MTIFDRLESNVRSYCRLFPAVFTSALGSQLKDDTGKTYIDFLSGGGALNYGHNDPEIKGAVIEFLGGDNLIHSLDLQTTAKGGFLEALEKTILQPRQLEYKIQFTGPTGATGVEAALKLARLLKKRSNIIAFSNGFHGLTLGALATTGNVFFRNQAFTDRHNVSFMPYDGYLGEGYHTIDFIRKFLEDPGSGVDLPAAVLVETVQAEGGINVAGEKWLRDLAVLCRQLDILLIVDDIQAGVGRTGTFFSFEKAGIYPDIVVLSKSLSGLGLPMAMVLMRPELDVWQPGEHAGTFRGNNLAFVAATKALQKFWQNDSLSDGIRRKGKYIETRLRTIAGQYPPDRLAVRGRGMLYGLQTTGAEAAATVIQACFQHGLLVEPCGPYTDVLKLSPPLTIGDDLLSDGLDILENALLQQRGARSR